MMMGLMAWIGMAVMGVPFGVFPTAPPPALSDDDRRKGMMASKMLMATFGEITSLLMRTPSHKLEPMGDLEWPVAEPTNEKKLVPAILTGQFTLVESQSKTQGFTAPIAVALWASVSPEVDRRLTENISAPIRLKMEEWKSGDIPWLVEAAGEPRVIEEMLKRLVYGPWAGREVKMRARTKDGAFKVALFQFQVAA